MEEKICRICLSADPYESLEEGGESSAWFVPKLVPLPCKCTGYVHIQCLNQWRWAKGPEHEIPFYRCEVCKNLYTFIKCHLSNKSLMILLGAFSAFLHFLGLYLTHSPPYVILVGSLTYTITYLTEGSISILTHRRCPPYFLIFNMDLLLIGICYLMPITKQILPVLVPLVYGKTSYFVLTSAAAVLKRVIDSVNWLFT